MPDTTPEDGENQDDLAYWSKHRNEYTPGELIKRLPELPLKQYLAQVVGHWYPDPLIEKHGLETVRDALSILCETYGATLRDLKNPPGFLDWTLKNTAPSMGKYLDGLHGPNRFQDDDDLELNKGSLF